MESMFELLETQKLLESGAQVTLLPGGEQNDLLAPLLATNVHTEKTVQGIPPVRRKLPSE
jgi:hypothetical protein